MDKWLNGTEGARAEKIYTGERKKKENKVGAPASAIFALYNVFCALWCHTQVLMIKKKTAVLEVFIHIIHILQVQNV